MISVLIVDDSRLVTKMIQELLSCDPDISVVGTAKNGREAIEMAQELRPDLITMDIHMPGVDGLEATQQIMAHCPTRILILSASVFKAGMDKVFKALSYGALEVVDKTALEGFKENGPAQKDLIEKIKLLSRIRVVRHPLRKIEESLQKIKRYKGKWQKDVKPQVVGIASSTGGAQALLAILKSFPPDFPCPLVVVQHMSPGFIEGFAQWLDGEVALKVKVAGQGEILQSGTVYLAPSDRQMRVVSPGKISLVDEDQVDFQKPSGTVLLESLAKAYGPRSLGVILTGMGSDGARGMKSIFEAKGHTIAQDEESCVIYGMPKSAIALGAAHVISPLNEIAEKIIQTVEGSNAVSHL